MKLVESLDGVDAVFITADKKIYVTDGLKDTFILRMKARNLNMLKKGDFFILGFVLILIIVSFTGVYLYKNSGSNAHKIAVIIKDNEEIKRIDIDNVNEPLEISVSGEYNNIILVEKGRIRFKEADCPDRVCVNTGWLTGKGDTAVCLPNKTMIKIEGQSSDVDIVTY